MSNLSSQTNKVSIVFNLPFNDNDRGKYEYLILEWLRSVSNEFYFIYHNKDINLDTGELKTPHFHILAILCNKDRPRLLNTLNNFADSMHLNDMQRSLISIEIWKDHDAGIQYLTHKNSTEKYQYSVDDVYTSCTDMFQAVMLKDSLQVITIDYLFDLCSKCSYRTEVYRIIGLERSKLYRNIINDMWNDSKIIKDSSSKDLFPSS